MPRGHVVGFMFRSGGMPLVSLFSLSLTHTHTHTPFTNPKSVNRQMTMEQVTINIRQHKHTRET